MKFYTDIPLIEINHLLVCLRTKAIYQNKPKYFYFKKFIYLFFNIVCVIIYIKNIYPV